ncbi:DISARM system phospholipase D-like protein DrmC [Nostoc sp. 'Peltigera membranacea cyanobiont' N6]|uniref:DISARM system phospholipase D-like protein DrmC n=1 Tax=Nostoc sp. 'Peltigera membranacea cyanobiont' N6 TaxID=1261031 RepID=UPI000CF35DB0|nr:DISARM system phospholipase D-like protein DrmC [Nostoc sp. 'Peltigera membranacea cyanobiont' N6]AVH68329.1 phospholipase D [Nostoc sp. 'Peltigera membranacea cyanobiont' N6]
MGFLNLSRPTLVNLAAALETGRLSPPFSISNVANYIPAALNRDIVDELNRLNVMGVHFQHIAYTLRLLAEERSTSQAVSDRVDLVWTGPEIAGSQSRDTSVVVRELFSTAKISVLISSFAIDKRQKARELFMVLAERMDFNPELNVRMFLNVNRPHNNEVPTSTLLREFANSFRQDIWPGKRLPEVFHDPRSLTVGVESKACLHAKCVVVDKERVLVTSANFTEAAHERNIEAGVLLNDPVTAIALQMQFESLVTRNILCRIPGI